MPNLTFDLWTYNTLHGIGPTRLKRAIAKRRRENGQRDDLDFSTFTALRGIGGTQESDKTIWHAGAYVAFEGRVHSGTGPLAENALCWSDDWTVEEKWATKTHSGEKGISPHRGWSGVVVRHETGVRGGLLDTHYISGAWSKRLTKRKAWRKVMWNQHHDLLKREVRRLLDRDDLDFVVVLGDFNRRASGYTIPGLKLASRASMLKTIDHIWISPNLHSLEVKRGPALGSDHKPVRARVRLGAPVPPKPKPDPEVVVDDRYELTTHDGKTVDRMTKQALEKAERRLGYPLTIVQGSYNQGRVSQSAGTHDGGGVVDLAPWDWERKVRVLREIGFAAWHRTPAQGPWGEHIHAVLIGNTKAAPSALRQVDAYRRGRNGLANNGLDDFWRPKTIKPYVYKAPPPPSRISVFRRAVEEALAVTMPKINSVDRPAAYRMLKEIQAALEKGPKA